MRIFMQHILTIGKKHSAEDIFLNIEQYLKDNILGYRILLFKFENYIIEFYHNNEFFSNREKNSIIKVCKKMPELKHLFESNAENRFFISNYDENGIPKDSADYMTQIRTIVSKIPRPYHFEELKIKFSGINFFDAEIENSGSYIGIYIDGIAHRNNAVVLNIDITNEKGDIYDDAIYADAFHEYFPEAKSRNQIYEKLTVDESDFYRNLDLKTYDINQKIKEALINPCGKLGNYKSDSSDIFSAESRFSVAGYLKKIINKYGFKYLGYEYYVYSIRKIDKYGNAIISEIICPTCKRIDISLTYEGLGFNYMYTLPSYTPSNQRQADDYLDAVMEFISNLETSYLHKIGEIYPPTPKWFFNNQ